MSLSFCLYTLISVVFLIAGSTAVNTKRISNASSNQNAKQFFDFKNLECTCNPTIVLVVCSFRTRVNLTADISIKQEYIRTVTALTGEVRIYYKAVSAKRYKPTVQRQKMNYCFMTMNMPNFLTALMPDTIDKFTPPCPLSGKHELNFTVPLIPVDSKFYRAGDYRFDLSFTTDDEVAVWKLMAYLSVQD